MSEAQERLKLRLEELALERAQERLKKQKSAEPAIQGLPEKEIEYSAIQGLNHTPEYFREKRRQELERRVEQAKKHGW